jgi:hypothetical protein
MKEKLITLLQSFGYPVRLQGSLGVDEAYPDSFFTFWNNDSYDGNHYDNDAIYWIWNFDVNFYSTDPALVNSMLLQAKTLLKQNGFIITGKGYDVASDEPTHTGRGMNALIIEYKED